MNKVELVKLIAEKNGITKKLAEEYIKVVFDGIQDGLTENDKVQIQGVITFEVKDRPERSGTLTNKDGEEIEWHKEAGKRVAVKLSKSFTRDIVGE